MPDKLEVSGRWHKGGCILPQSTKLIIHITRTHGCFRVQLLHCSFAGSHHTGQASIRVSHTSPCTLGPSKPDKKLCRYDTDRLNCYMQQCVRHRTCLHSCHINVKRCCGPSCGCHTVGKKDTSSSEVQAITHVDGAVPFGINRVASILAGRTRSPMVTSSQALSIGFTSLPIQAGNSRGASWRSFAAHGACR